MRGPSWLKRWLSPSTQAFLDKDVQLPSAEPGL